ncbi:MAG: type III-B CRISPR module-associated protein Cmr3 [Bacteroidetes bacterium]|nr:type III-B CRISPR module-associated protein Cmr3 [Bacteroidota bacterium]
MMHNQSDILCLSLRPIDTLFFRDARPFGPSRQANSGLPSPQTLAGAIRTLLLEAHGVNLQKFGEKVRATKSFDQALREMGGDVSAIADVKIAGPWLCRNEDILVSMPANLKSTKSLLSSFTQEDLVRLDPLRTPPHGWQPKEKGLLPLWYYGRKSLKSLNECYLTLKGMDAYLNGGIPEINTIVNVDKLYTIDRRVGIGIDGKLNTTAEGLIYSAGMLSLKKDVSFYAEVKGHSSTIDPLNQSSILMKFGGEGRHVEVSTRTGAIWPEVSSKGGDGNLLVLTTPAWFDGWKPKNLSCMAAAVPGFDGISGWDLALGGPKPNRFMVQSGSVYYLRHNEKLSRDLVNYDDSLVGWGKNLKGIWKYV